MTVAIFFTHVHALAVAVLSACQRTAEIAIITGTLTVNSRSQRDQGADGE
jgi:hypothetical protein